MTDTPLQQLEDRFRRISLLDDALGILDWDQATTMPDGSAAARGEQVAALQGLRHQQMTDPRVAELLAAAEESADKLHPWPAANLREMRRRHTHATALPTELVEAQAKADAACEMKWRTARAEDDYESLRPSLEEVLRLTQEAASAKAAALGLDPYDALLDQFEPGGRAARLDTMFADLAGFLPGFLEEVTAKQRAQPKPIPLQGPFSIEQQEAVARRFMGLIGFDFEQGRLDISHHPFCGGATVDVRITTRYDTDDFTSALMGVLHETGHAMYELGRPEEWRYQPVGEARGMGLHESQSLIVEMQACRSLDFLSFAAPVLAEAFDGDGAAWTPENLYRLNTRVKPDFIRVDADEVTYPAHIILRYRLERALLAGDLLLADLPGAWNDGMVELLGICPPDNRLGCLQDIHWPSGAWGYFPTYTIGAMAAAQLFAAARETEADVVPGLRRGDFLPLITWLRATVHNNGSLLSTDEVLEKATGRALDPATYEAHLRARYLH